MTRCANDHEPITHDEFHCPLCAALEDARESETRTEDMRGLVYQLEATIDAMEAIGEGLSPTDICSILAESEETDRQSDALRRKVQTFHDAIYPARKVTLGKQIEAIRASYVAILRTR